jgi:hypothetical protein
MGRILNWEVETKPKNKLEGFRIDKYKFHSKIKEGELKFELLNKEYLKTTNYRFLEEGESIHLDATKIHTVACEKGKVSAWLVYEGKEDNSHESICYSNSNPNTVDTSQLYQKPTIFDIRRLLDICGLYSE